MSVLKLIVILYAVLELFVCTKLNENI